MKWVDRIGEYNVEKKEGPRPGGQPYIPLSNPKAFVLHTTEGNSVDGAVATLRSRFSCPHFVVGENRIVQMRPLDGEGATLVNHNDIGWQVESVGHSSQSLHLLTPATLNPLIALGVFVTQELNVPLARPNQWKDNGSDIDGIWAANNSRRKSRTALGFRGWVGHLDVPDQDPTWHWDPGAFNYTEFFARVAGGTGDDEVGYAEYKEGIKRRKADKPRPAEEGDLRFGWDVQDSIEKAKELPKPTEPGPHSHEGTVTVS